MPPVTPFAYTLAVVAAISSPPLAAVILAIVGFAAHWYAVAPR